VSDVGWSPLTFFQEGGFAMYFALCGGVLAHLLALASIGALFAQRRAFPLGMGAATLLFALSTALVGVLGYVWGMQQVNEAVAYVDPSQAEMIRQVGQDEADNNLWLGGLLCILPSLVGVLAISRGAMMKDATPSKP
jgi:hypothetical protein